MLDDETLEYVQKYWSESATREEILREENFPLVDVQTAIAWAMIKKFCDNNIKTVLDAGAGFGRYSVPMAKFGYEVTHFDISESMINTAKAITEKADIKNISFVEGTVTDMSMFADKEFDLSFCFDAPISYAYPYHAEALKEVLRVTKDTVMLMVSNRNGVLPFMIDFDITRGYDPDKKYKNLESFYITKKILSKGIEEWPDEIKKDLIKNGNEAPLDYSFTVDEIFNLIKSNGFDILKIGGPGALARSVKPQTLETIRSDERLFNQFIQFSLDYDFDKNNIGLGAVNLFVIAKRVV